MRILKTIFLVVVSYFTVDQKNDLDYSTIHYDEGMERHVVFINVPTKAYFSDNYNYFNAEECYYKQHHIVSNYRYLNTDISYYRQNHLVNDYREYMFAKYHPIHYYLNINNLVKDPAEVSLHSKRDDGIVVYCYGYLTNCLVFIPFCKKNEVQTLSSCTGDAGESYRDVSILNDSILITNRIHTLYDFEAPKENRNFDVFTKTTTAYNIYTESRWSADTINYTENYNVRIHSEDFYSYRKKDKLMSVPWDN